MSAYYNEHDRHAAAWLRELIVREIIAPGEVDERSIEEVTPNDLRGFVQCHFFAGIGVWSYALRRAGWADATPVWTGSCPCQPFSASGKGRGTDDHRHLWPAWFRLIRECQPHVCFGEQVASKDGLAWLDFVSSDLEGAGYAIGACDTCAAGVGAPHIRQRLYFVAESYPDGRAFVGATRLHEDGPSGDDAARRGATRRMADTDEDGAGQLTRELPSDEGEHEVGGAIGDYASVASRAAGIVGDTEIERCGTERERDASSTTAREGQRLIGAGATGIVGHTTSGGRRERGGAALAREERHPNGAVLAGFWRDAEWIECTDGKARPTEPGTFPLVTGAAARVVRLRGYGNAICAPQAVAFVEAYLAVRGAS